LNQRFKRPVIFSNAVHLHPTKHLNALDCPTRKVHAKPEPTHTFGPKHTTVPASGAARSCQGRSTWCAQPFGHAIYQDSFASNLVWRRGASGGKVCLVQLCTPPSRSSSCEETARDKELRLSLTTGPSCPRRQARDPRVHAASTKVANLMSCKMQPPESQQPRSLAKHPTHFPRRLGLGEDGALDEFA
jgi:hypothetical protein